MQEQPGLVVLVIELENALTHMHTTVEPSKMWSPYREPLAKFLNKYTVEVAPYLRCCPLVAILCILDAGLLSCVSFHICKQGINSAHLSKQIYPADTMNETTATNGCFVLSSRPNQHQLAKGLLPLQAVEYFLETSRMANTNYFHRFVDILRSPMGSPLLTQLAASERKLGELLAYPSVLPSPVPGAPETAQVCPLEEIKCWVRQPDDGQYDLEHCHGLCLADVKTQSFTSQSAQILGDSCECLVDNL